MRNTLPLWLLAPLALSAVACGDDESVGTGGSGGGTNGATTSATSATTGTMATSSTGGEGGSTGEGGAGGDSGGFGGAQGEGGFTFGEAIDAPAAEWSWVDFPESRCINDTPTGIGVNPSPSNEEDVVIFLMGGNACFNTTSCLVTANTNGYGADKFAAESALDAEVFSREAEASPIGDWNFVFVPYCTGDVHAGDRLHIEVGGQDRRFRGFVNMTDYLERLVPTFPNARRVLLTGVSAGGFGAAYNYDQVKRAFGPDVDVYLLDDSGPPMSEEFVPACLQSHFRATWGLDNTLPADCAECFAGDTFTDEFMTYVTSTYDDQRFGLISSEEDSTIRAFWGFGNDDCADIDAQAPPAYSGSKYTDGLTDMRDRFGGPNYAMFTPPGTRHVWVNDQAGLDTTIGESPTLEAWIGELISDDPAWQSWPAE